MEYSLRDANSRRIGSDDANVLKRVEHVGTCDATLYFRVSMEFCSACFDFLILHGAVSAKKWNGIVINTLLYLFKKIVFI